MFPLGIICSKICITLVLDAQGCMFLPDAQEYVFSLVLHA